MSSTSSGRPRRQFTKEFKADAVAMVEASGGEIAKVARELGIHDSSLGNGVRRAREEAEGAPSVEERAEIRDLRRELERVRRERDILGKGRGLPLGARPEERVVAMYSFIAEEQADPDCDWSVGEMCRTLQVSRSGYYDWVDRQPSPRELSDRMLTREIEAIWECSDRTCGSPRVWRWLLEQGFTVGLNRVAWLMRLNGWEGETGRRRVRTTIVEQGARAATDRVRRDFNPPAPDVAWCGDITYCAPGRAGCSWPRSTCTRGG